MTECCKAKSQDGIGGVEAEFLKVIGSKFVRLFSMLFTVTSILADFTPHLWFPGLEISTDCTWDLGILTEKHTPYGFRNHSINQWIAFCRKPKTKAETLSLRNLKIMPINLNEIAFSWIRLQLLVFVCLPGEFAAFSLRYRGSIGIKRRETFTTRFSNLNITHPLSIFITRCTTEPGNDNMGSCFDPYIPFAPSRSKEGGIFSVLLGICGTISAGSSVQLTDNGRVHCL